MNLLDLRKNRGMTQLKLARLTSVAQSTICKIENKELRPSPEVAERIAKVFDLDVDTIWNMFYKTSA